MPSDFAQKYGPWALVTGGSAGIGLQFSHQLAAAGLNIAIAALGEEELIKAAGEIREKYGVETKYLLVDLTSEDGWRNVVESYDDIEVGLLVNNAGIETHGSLFRDPVEKHVNIIDLNCKALVALTHAFGRRMVDRKRGGIIFTSSLLSTPAPFFATYSASKSFVTSFGRAVREEFIRYNVQVTVLEPGIVESDMSKNIAKNMDFSKSGFSIQKPDDCVREALDAFASGKVKHIAGLGNRISMNVIRSLPEPVQMAMLAGSIDRSISPEIQKFD